MSKDKIPELPVKNKKNEAGKLFLTKPPAGKCGHYNSGFTIDVNAGKCFCNDCKEEVSPMFVLERLMHQESRWMQSREQYQDEMKRLSRRSKTR